MRFKNVFCTQLYKDTFSKVLKEDEFTHGDEILVDMEEPDGDRISYIIMHHGHSISDCKAFVTTTDENVLIAVFDLWGKFYKCYIIKNDSIRNVEVENVLGGKEIKFDGESQYGKISVKLDVTKLKAKKKYYIRVRTYKTVKVNGKSKKIYSGWSKVKAVTTKK